MLKRTLFFTNKTSITTRWEQLVIKTEAVEKTVPIEDVGFVVIENQETYISIPALNKLIANNVAVIFCDAKHMPASMLLNLNGHHTQQELFSNQIKASEPLKKQLWRQIIKKKIKHQAQHLQLLERPFEVLKFHESKVLSGDTDNREGAAAAHYWKHVFDFDFKRERYGDYPNAFLNYGYIVLRAAVARSLAASGLLCTLGIHHHNKYNAFCLADDVMEPYRPMVDAKVIQIMAQHNETALTPEIKLALLSVLTQTVYFKTTKSPLMVALSRTASSLQKCYQGTAKKISYPRLWN